MYEKPLRGVIKTRRLGAIINVPVVMLNAELHALHRALQGFQLGALVSAVTAVHTRLDRLKGDESG
jgi:hypothetical protein